MDSYFLVSASRSWLVPHESRMTWLGCSKSPLIKLLKMQQKQRSLRIEQIICSKGLPKITVFLDSKISLLDYIWAALSVWDLHCDQGFCSFSLSPIKVLQEILTSCFCIPSHAGIFQLYTVLSMRCHFCRKKKEARNMEKRLLSNVSDMTEVLNDIEVDCTKQELLAGWH